MVKIKEYKHINILGHKSGLLTVIEKLDNRSKNGKVLWKAKCECGGEKIAEASNFKNLKIGSCGCQLKTTFKDLTNKKFNKITLIKYIGKNKQSCHIYEALCDCGKILNVEGNDISSGKQKSCGCAKKDYAKNKFLQDPSKGLYTQLFNDYKTKAKERSYVFELSRDEFIKLILDNCFYCGIEPLRKKQSKSKQVDHCIYWNGLDRRDNEKGYVIDNVVTCCYTCNQAKHQMTETYFLEWIKRVNNHQNAKLQQEAEKKDSGW